MALKKIFYRKMEKLRGSWRKLQNYELWVKEIGRACERLRKNGKYLQNIY